MIFVAIASMMAANAQLVSATTINKKKAPITWYVRAGISFDNAANIKSDDDWDEETTFGSSLGFEAEVGFQKNFAKSDAYWGMELGFGSRGCKENWKDSEDSEEWDKSTVKAYNIKWAPMIGYKYPINDMIKLDAHFGGFLSYDISHSFKYEEYYHGEKEKYSDWDDFDCDWKDFDAGIQVGVGIWYSRFNFDITYQRGFVGSELYYDDDYKIYSSNLMLRVGVSF